MKPFLYQSGHFGRRNSGTLSPINEGSIYTATHRTWIHSLLSQRETLFWCLSWFASNLIITFYNKHVLSSLNASPSTNTFVHMMITFIGCLMMQRGHFPDLNRSEFLRITMFAFIFAVNVVFCQYAIKLIPLSLQQLSRAMTPLFQVIFSWLIANQQPVLYSLIPLIPVCCGVAMTASAEIHLSWSALMVALLSIMLSSLKGVLSMKILQHDLKEKLQEYSFLVLVTPLAAVWIFWLDHVMQLVFWIGDFGDLHKDKDSENGDGYDVRMGILMIIGGYMAFAVNVACIGVSRRVLATSMGVMGNAKRSLTIFGSMMMFEPNWTFKKLLGIVVTLSGATWYAYRKEMLRHQKLR